jgi:chromosomal replication initiator protein
LRPQIESSLRRIIGRPITLEVIVGHAPRGTTEPSVASTVVDGPVADGSEDEHLVAVPEALPPTRRKAPGRPAVAMTSRPKAATTVILEDPTPATPAAPAPRPATGWTPNPNYTFAAYTVGQSNQTAHAAALSVAGDPGGGYNPLFVYGGVGLGKTHLLHAIANVVVRAGFRTLYVSAEEFTNDLVNAIREHRTEEFRLRYRTNDVLLIDDVQFIAGKEATQEEFFHTFNALHNVGHQIVLTSDRPPKAISNLAERLQSRFTWGIAVDIQLPDLETRRAILQKKADARRLQVSEPVLDFLASAIQSNIRELEGGLNRVVAYSQMTNQPISIQLARASIEDLVQSAQRRILSTSDVLDAVCRYYKIELSALRGKARDKDIVWPRHVAMFLMRQRTEASLVEVGRALGGRDHSTVLSGCDRIQKELQSDVQLRRDVDAIEDLLRGTARG